jgi:hypothetical protein
MTPVYCTADCYQMHSIFTVSPTKFNLNTSNSFTADTLSTLHIDCMNHVQTQDKVVTASVGNTTNCPYKITISVPSGLLRSRCIFTCCTTTVLSYNIKLFSSWISTVCKSHHTHAVPMTRGQSKVTESEPTIRQWTLSQWKQDHSQCAVWVLVASNTHSNGGNLNSLSLGYPRHLMQVC